MTIAAPIDTASTSFRPKQRLGFNTRVSFSDDAGPAQGLREGIKLFKAAEQLGYQSGWAYQRHFDHYLSSPLPFFAAAGQHTRHITLGSAVIPMRYQDPILLAEAAGTTDLLIDGRLELAISTGANAAFDAVFGTVDTDARTEARRRQARFLSAIAGDVLHRVEGGQSNPEGTALRVTPHSPTLRSRIRQGAASIASAVQAAELGIGLISGTVQHDQAEGESFGEYQARIIEAFRFTWRKTWTTEPPPVAVAASIWLAPRPSFAKNTPPMIWSGVPRVLPRLAPKALSNRQPSQRVSNFARFPWHARSGAGIGIQRSGPCSSR